MSFTSHYLSCAGRELHYTEWGSEHAETVIAWHGLARTCRDMDDIAAHLARRYRVICPDTIGRGLSQWSPAPEREYCLAFYDQLALGLLDGLGLDRFWRNARTHTLHDPVRWKYHAVGNYYLNDRLPPRHGAL